MKLSATVRPDLAGHSPLTRYLEAEPSAGLPGLV
jgi:hypothetical protein